MDQLPMPPQDQVSSIKALLLPDTPGEVAKRYMSLPQRAESTSFDLLEDDIVVLDTETTGLSFKSCELIQIAAARLQGRKVVERFETFVRPKKRIPKEITRLTGINDGDVRDAPEAQDAVAGLASFVAGQPVLAHNATFDRTFIEKVPGGREVSDFWIDTLALSRIALPRLKTHRLADMANAFGCVAVTHQANDDVDALSGMWRILLLGLLDLPQGLLSRLSDMHPDVDWSYRPILAHIAAMKPPEPFSMVAAREDVLAGNEVIPREDAGDWSSIHIPSVPSERDIEGAFAPGGLVSSMYGSYERRDDQIQMALEVREGLITSTHRVIEAGTGVGKSVAYLLPAALFAQQNQICVGVATKTNALSDQLVSHELPALASVLPQGLSYACLKGYDHYPCLWRVTRAMEEELPDPPSTSHARNSQTEQDILNALAVINAYAVQSLDGDLDALGIRWKNVPRELLTTTPTECLRARCPYFRKGCLLHDARRRAAGCDIVVTNHSFLLRDIIMDGRLLPPIRHWIIDEAHSFEAEGRRQWAREIGAQGLQRGFEQLGGTRTGAIHAAMTASSHEEGATLVVRLLTKAAAAATRASTSTSGLLDALHGLTSLVKGYGGYEAATLWIDEQVRKSEPWKQLIEAAHDAENRLRETDKCVREAAEKIAETAPQCAAELRHAVAFCREIADTLRLIVDDADTGYVYYAELRHHRRDIRLERLAAEKVDVGQDLGSKWLPEMLSVTFTSATMAVAGSFEHFDHAVGLDVSGAGEHRDLKLSSSFDFDNNMKVLIARDMPQPNDPAYLDNLTDLLFDIHRAMGGSVLTLFTNRREMERVYSQLEPRLAEEGLELKCQERNSSPRGLRQAFIENQSLSLMALRSFWEGFDAAGETLRCVVIPKLPFSSPTDPLVRERDLREPRAWWRYSLPEAVISVRQAAGRLIRSASDKGILVLADSRIVSKRYGRQFTSSLPSRSIEQVDTSELGRNIVRWRKDHGV